jgi:ubiquinone/menaquinone biosynthesis C-methylase UbiE
MCVFCCGMAHLFQGDFSRLETAERKKMLPAFSILKEMNIRKGEMFIDFGCGIGYFSIPALDFVGPHGSVIAVDVSKEMLTVLARRAGVRKNLKLIQNDTVSGLSADIILLSMVLHEVDDPQAFIGFCRAVLKPCGRIFVIDWQRKETGFMGPPIEHRIAKEDVLGMASGMNYVDHLIHEWLYFLEFRK